MKKYHLIVSGAVALVGSLIVNALLIKIFLPLTGVPSSVMTFKVLGPTGFFTVIGVVGATIVFAIVRRLSKQPNRLFTQIAIVVFLLSLLPDIFIHHLGPLFDQVTTGGIALLMAMHAACALITVWALTKLTRPKT